MTRSEFMKELENLLSDIPSDEKSEAIQYYNNYLDDAGIEQEDEVLKELGSPSQVAAIIKADLNMNPQEQANRGNFTETGYQDTVYKDEKYELDEHVQAAEGEQAKGAGANGKTNGRISDTGADIAKIALIVLLCIFAVPVVIPLFFSLFGILFAVMATIFFLFIGFGIAGAVLVFVGLTLIALGLANLGVSLACLAYCGGGLITFGVGTMLLIVSILLCGKVLPAIIRGIVKIVRLPFDRRRVAA